MLPVAALTAMIQIPIYVRAQVKPAATGWTMIAMAASMKAVLALSLGQNALLIQIAAQVTVEVNADRSAH